MSSFIRPCILAVMLSSSLLACDGESSDIDTTELRSGEASCSGPFRLRELYDPHDLAYVEDLTVHVFVDPATAPMDIVTAVIDSEALIALEGPFGIPLKLQLKITVMPVSRPVE